MAAAAGAGASSDSEFWADEAAWQAKIVADKFDVTVPEHKQVSGGFFAKSYTTYQVISPLCVEGVWRRYSDFEFIRDMLVSRFHGLIVPLLPDKRVVGNMEDTFIESRRVALNEWVRKVVASPYLRLDATLKQFFTVAGESDFEQAKKAALAGAGANPATNEGLARWFGCLRHYGLPDDAEAAIAELADLNNTIEEAARRALIACDAHLKATRASIDSMSKICSSMDRWTEVTRGQADKTCETLAGVKAESLKLAELTSKTAEAWRETLSLAKFADNEIQLFLMGALANEIARCQAQTALLAVRRAALEAYGRAWKEKDSLEFQQKKYREKSDEARAAQLEPKIAEATRLTRQMKERLDDVTKGILHVEATAAAAKRVQMLTVAFGSFATTQIASGNNSHDIWGGFLSKAGIDREEAIKKAQSIIDAKQDDEEFRVILATAPTMGPAPRTRKEGDDDDSAFGAAAAAAAAAAASAPAPAAAAAASSRAAGDEEGDMM